MTKIVDIVYDLSRLTVGVVQYIYILYSIVVRRCNKTISKAGKIDWKYANSSTVPLYTAFKYINY